MRRILGLALLVVLETLGIREPKAIVNPVSPHLALAQPPRPEVEGVGRPDSPHDPVDHPVAGAAHGDARVLEEGQVGAGVPLLVRVEEVVDGRVVLVDRLLDQPQAENAGVEVDIPRRVAGDAGDVVDAVQAHDP